MAIKRDGKKWLVDIRTNGANSKRIRKKFDTKAEAERFASHTKGQAAANQDWNPDTHDNRRLSELCQLWYALHGKQLKDGQRRLRKLSLICEALHDPIAQTLTPRAFMTYRAEKPNASQKTLNNELGYINAVYNELYRIEEINYDNPLKKVRPIKLVENELSFLTGEQIAELFDSLKQATNPHVALITKISLATGCRWSEAENLHTRQVTNKRITFTDTKSRKNRTVPISAALEKEILNHGEGKLFTASLSAFRRALDRTTIELPKGQAAHVLRHTYASHYMMHGRDIRSLQQILGHSNINITMRYAHLAPKHLDDAAQYNPLENPAV